MPTPKPSARETMLTFMLLALLGAGFLLFFVGIMGLFVIHALFIVGILAFFGLFHYFLWGRSLSQQVTAEEGEPNVLRTEDNGWPPDGPHRPTGY